MTPTAPENEPNTGKVTRIRGSVVDVRFDVKLPAINTLLLTGQQEQIKIEVFTQLDAHHVRGIAMNPTQGLARGMAVASTGKQLSVPVGRTIMGRMFDVFGNTIDHQQPPLGVKWHSIHQPPPALSVRTTKSEVFITGIKAIDVLIPLERGGKAGLFGGAGVATL